jgi:hypothetical protein
MKTLSVYSLSPADLVVGGASEAAEPTSSLLARCAAALRSIFNDQRQELAALDSGTLRDLGVEPDEIARIHCGNDFTPRAWK